jgi:hypothetical protein
MEKDNTTVILVLGGVAAVYFLTRRPVQSPAPAVTPTSPASPSGSSSSSSSSWSSWAQGQLGNLANAGLGWLTGAITGGSGSKTDATASAVQTWQADDQRNY